MPARSNRSLSALERNEPPKPKRTMTTFAIIASFAAGIAAAFYAPKLWTAAKAWIVAKLS